MSTTDLETKAQLLFARIVTDSGDKIPRSQVTAMVANALGTSPLVIGMYVGIMNCAADLVGGEPTWKPPVSKPLASKDCR
jgi:hypothetical protein